MDKLFYAIDGIKRCSVKSKKMFNFSTPSSSMGSDMKLTGLASGFDWQPIVDQLIDLERSSVRRLEREKSENDSKVSQLGTLKSQLDTLKNAAKALEEESLFNARKVTVDKVQDLFFQHPQKLVP